MGLWAEGGGATLFGAAFTVWWQPWSQKRREARRDKKILKLFMRGDDGLPGLMAKIVPGPERVQALEAAFIETSTTLREYGEILRRHDTQFVAQADTLDRVQKGVTNLTREVIQWQNENRKNGGNGPGFGDSLSRIEIALKTEDRPSDD